MDPDERSASYKRRRVSEPLATSVHLDLNAIRSAWRSRHTAEDSEQDGRCQYSAASLKVMVLRRPMFKEMLFGNINAL